jgi:hypothetical protein
MLSPEKGNCAVSESEVKVTLNGSNAFRMPLLDFAKIALPSAIGEFPEQGFARAWQGWEKMTEALRETYSSNARSATDYGLKVIEISNANTASALDFFFRLFSSKSSTDVVALSVAQARKAVDTASDQSKELWALTQKLATETGEPIRKHFSNVLHRAG